MLNILIQENYIIKEKYIKIIENLKNNNNINIDYFTNLSNIKNIEKYIIIICDEKLNITDSVNNIISGLKKLLNLMPSMKDRMNILKNICKNIPVILFSCGPSSNINFDKLKNIEDKYIIVGIKYSRDILLNNNISIDFTIQSFWSYNDYMNKLINSNELNSISLFLTPKENPLSLKNDILFTPSLRFPHRLTFNFIEIMKDINIIKITEEKITDDFVYFYLAHVMLEVAIPFSIFIGCDNIFTFGWDGPIDNKYSHLYNNINSTINNTGNPQEYHIMHIIDEKIFMKNNINVFKCNKISPINLRFKDILM